MKMSQFAEYGSRIATICLLLLITGCGSQDQIHHYQVARPKPPHRMLGAVVPQGDVGWFFKLTGADALVAAQADQFATFIQSIRFAEEPDSDPRWELPERWQQIDGEGMRFATIEIPTDEKTLEVSVIALPGQGGAEALVSNLNRWRGQIGLSPIQAAQLGDHAEQFDIDGVTATLVNMTGKMGQSAPMAAPFAGGGLGADADAAHAAAGIGHTHQLTYDAPSTWHPGQLVVSRGGVEIRRHAAFIIGEGQQQAEVTVTSLPATGSTLLNVNRWRRQISLEPLSQSQLADETTEVQINGEPAEYFRLVGPERAILGVISSHGGMLWFTKLQGPHDVAVELEEEFKLFVRSIKY